MQLPQITVYLITMVVRLKIPPLALSCTGMDLVGVADFGHSFAEKNKFR